MCRFRFYSILFLPCIALLLLDSCQQQKQRSGSSESEPETSVSSSDSISTNTQNGYDFTPHLKSGDEYYYTISNTTDIITEYNGEKTKSSNTSDVGLIYQVTADTGNQYEVKLTYKKMHTLNKKGDVTEEMDADNKYSFNATEKLLSGLKDQSVYMTLSKKGELLSVKGYNEMAANAVEQVHLDDDDAKKALQTQLTSMLGENFIKSSIVPGDGMTPVQSLQEGSTWTKKIEENIPFPVGGSTKYTLENVDGDVAEITASSDLKSNAQNTTVMGSQVTTDLKGTSDADYHINAVTGMIMDEEVKMNLEGTIQTMGREVPIKVAVKRSVVVKKTK